MTQTGGANKGEDFKPLLDSFVSFFTKEFADSKNATKAEVNEIVMRALLSIIAGKDNNVSAEDKIKAISLYKEFLEMFFSDLRNDDKI